MSDPRHVFNCCGFRVHPAEWHAVEVPKAEDPIIDDLIESVRFGIRAHVAEDCTGAGCSMCRVLRRALAVLEVGA